MRSLVLALVLAAAPLGAVAQSQQEGMDHSTMEGMEGHSGMQMLDHGQMAGVHTDATVNSVGDGTMNISHGPIAEIGWPAMTMDLAVLDGAEMGEIEPGDEVVLMLEKGPDGMYGIRAVMPKE